MIRLSNGFSFEYVVASGALAFDGQGWLWEKPLVKAGLIKPELFTVVIKTLTYHPRKGNLRWWKPWECVRLLPGGGAVNKVGLTNPGVYHWANQIGPRLDYKKFKLMGSIFGTYDEMDELVEAASLFNEFRVIGIEVNVSCPNTGHSMESVYSVIRCVTAIKEVTHHPIIVKVSVDQPYLDIAKGLKGVAEAISLNSVPWTTAYPNSRSPLWPLEKKVGGGGGGVSGKPAQAHNWKAVRELALMGHLPVIGPSVMEFEDMQTLRDYGAKAISFGAIHLRTPWKPTQFVLREERERNGNFDDPAVV